MFVSCTVAAGSPLAVVCSEESTERAFSVILSLQVENAWAL